MFEKHMIRRDDMMNRERNERNRELIFKIEGMKEMDKNDVLEKGGWMNEGMNMMNTM